MKLKHCVVVCAIALVLWLPAFAGVYNSANPAILAPGGTVTVWNAETPTPSGGTTAASQQVALVVTSANEWRGATPFSVDGQFSGDPGTFEVDVQVAGNDSETSYTQCASCAITTTNGAVTGNYTFHLDFPGTARYARLLMVTRTNSVSITARISR